MKKLKILSALGLYFIVVGAGLAMADIPVQNTDSEILGVLSAIDQNEILAAQLAEQKTIDHTVINYARMLDLDHNQHLDQTRELSQKLGMTIEENPSLDEIRDKGSNDLAALTALDAEDFSQLYIADMIKRFSEALNWIDSQDTQNQQVKDFLNESRKYMAVHFDKAQKIEESQLNK